MLPSIYCLTTNDNRKDNIKTRIAKSTNMKTVPYFKIDHILSLHIVQEQKLYFEILSFFVLIWYWDTYFFIILKIIIFLSSLNQFCNLFLDVLSLLLFPLTTWDAQIRGRQNLVTPCGEEKCVNGAVGQWGSRPVVVGQWGSRAVGKRDSETVGQWGGGTVRQ